MYQCSSHGWFNIIETGVVSKLFEFYLQRIMPVARISLRKHTQIPLIASVQLTTWEESTDTSAWRLGQELLPEKRLLRHPNLAKAVGSDPLASRLAALRPDVHVFGHTHFSWDASLHGTRFVQWPLAYPSERARRCLPLFDQAGSFHPNIRLHACTPPWQALRQGSKRQHAVLLHAL